MRWAGFLALLAGCDWMLGMPEPMASSIDAPAMVDGRATDGRVPDGPAYVPTSCKDAHSHGVTTDGLVTIDPDGSGPRTPFQTYCEMTTSGGGWTLVYSYGFNNPNPFDNLDNAVTPRPDWAVNINKPTPLSTTTPTSPTLPAGRGAMPFLSWRDFGSEFLVISNINNWVRCSPGAGSLVTLTPGAVTCDIVKVLVTPGGCTQATPNNLQVPANGVELRASGKFYYWDASTTENWPTHDPCGLDQQNQLTNVTDPGGAIFVR